MFTYVNGSSSLMNNSFSNGCGKAGLPSGITRVLERRRDAPAGFSGVVISPSAGRLGDILAWLLNQMKQRSTETEREKKRL